MTRLFCAFLLSLLARHASAANFTASVDRSRLSEGETLELSLESDDATLFGKPDLTPLDEAFDVLGTRQINRLTTIDGSARATTRWIITLQPKNVGNVLIPALSLGENKSEPITLQVIKTDQNADSESVAPVFIDASLDQDSVYVQAQAILTLRIYHSVSLYDDSALTPLQIADARIESLGDPRTYEKEINGVRHGVIELRYAIYPQQSGELEIPALVFSATVADRTQNNSGYQPFGPRPGRLMRVKSPVI